MHDDLEHDWHATKDHSRLAWTDAKRANQAAWLRVCDSIELLTPGYSNHDGKQQATRGYVATGHLPRS